MLRLNAASVDDVAITISKSFEASPLIGTGSLDTRSVASGTNSPRPSSNRSNVGSSHADIAPHPNLAGIMGPCIVAVTANNTGHVKSDCRGRRCFVQSCADLMPSCLAL